MRLYRQSGMPVDKIDHKEYSKAINEVMDQVEAIYGKCNKDNAVEFAAKLETYHRELTKKYPIYRNISFPSSMKEMTTLLKEYGSAVAFCLEDDKLVAYIMAE